MANFKVNDVVRVINDISQVHTLQENHGGWSDDMALVRKTWRLYDSLVFTQQNCECLLIEATNTNACIHTLTYNTTYAMMHTCICGLPHRHMRTHTYTRTFVYSLLTYFALTYSRTSII